MQQDYGGRIGGAQFGVTHVEHAGLDLLQRAGELRRRRPGRGLSVGDEAKLGDGEAQGGRAEKLAAARVDSLGHVRLPWSDLGDAETAPTGGYPLSDDLEVFFRSP